MKMKKRLAVILAFALAFTMSMSSVAFAAEGDGYLALGSDLSESERNTVMDLLGVDDPENYNVIYVTNAEEHKYLDSYVDTNQIGSRALSSVLIKEQGGSDIDVEIHNIGIAQKECTEMRSRRQGSRERKLLSQDPLRFQEQLLLLEQSRHTKR